MANRQRRDPPVQPPSALPNSRNARPIRRKMPAIQAATTRAHFPPTGRSATGACHGLRHPTRTNAGEAKVQAAPTAWRGMKPAFRGQESSFSIANIGARTVTERHVGTSQFRHGTPSSGREGVSGSRETPSRRREIVGCSRGGVVARAWKRAPASMKRRVAAVEACLTSVWKSCGNLFENVVFLLRRHVFKHLRINCYLRPQRREMARF
jgi:hypothetical protein